MSISGIIHPAVRLHGTRLRRTEMARTSQTPKFNPRIWQGDSHRVVLLEFSDAGSKHGVSEWISPPANDAL